MTQSSTNIIPAQKQILWAKESEYALGLYRLVFKIIGIWSFDCENFAPTCLFLWSCFTQISMIITICGEFLITGIVDPQSISSMTCNILSVLKISMIRKNRLKVKRIFETLIDAWENYNHPEVLTIMKDYARLGRLILIYQLFPTYFAILGTIIGVLPTSNLSNNETSNDTEMILVYPIPSSNLFAGMPSSFFWILFIYQSLQLILTITANIGTDCCFFGMAMNLTALLEGLSINLENHNNENGKPYFDLRTIVRRQIVLIELVIHLEEIFNIIILFVVSMNVSQVCFYGIQMIRCIRAGDISIAAQTAVFIMILIIQIYLYSYAGDRLSFGIENFGNAAYHCQWDEMQLKNQKNLIFIMMRTRRIFNLTAGGIYRMDLDTFKDIIKAIGSYFSVMQAMFE